MLQEQKSHPPKGISSTISRTTPKRIYRKKRSSTTLYLVLRYLLWGALIALVLALVGVVVIWLLNPFHFAGALAGRFLSTLLLPVQIPWIIPGVMLCWLIISYIVASLGLPLALRSYLRGIQSSHVAYQETYCSLAFPMSTRLLGKASAPDTPTALAAGEEQQQPLLETMQQANGHCIVLGPAGIGKTTALQVYQYIASQRPLALAFSRERIPLYIPLNYYSLYLKKHLTNTGEPATPLTLAAFLADGDLPGIEVLQPFLTRLVRQGRFIFLCDGLDEVERQYQDRVCEELVRLLRETKNRLVITGREIDYREQPDLLQVVNDDLCMRVVAYPLTSDQVYLGVEQFVAQQDRSWQHTAGQIRHVMESGRLQDYCANPMMLFTFLRIIDKIGMERGRQIATRGQLLAEYVQLVIEEGLQDKIWRQQSLNTEELLRFLSELACAARWFHASGTIQLAQLADQQGESRHDGVEEESSLADDLRYWLDEHPARGPFDTEGYTPPPFEPFENVQQLIEFALSVQLIVVDNAGRVSFPHKLLAEYFVAEYFVAATNQKRTIELPLHDDLLSAEGAWSEVVALWAGLLDDPAAFIERLVITARQKPAYEVQALTLAMLVTGVLWQPPQVTQGSNRGIPASLQEALVPVLHNPVACKELAQSIMRCAEEDGDEIYVALPLLVLVDGIDDLFVLLDPHIVPDLLFTYLQVIVDDSAYEAQVRRLTRILARFDGLVVETASELCQPAPERSLRLRTVAVNILGGTHDADAVEPLVARLSDAEPYIVERAANGLYRLGPDLTLTRMVQLVEDRTQSPFILRLHHAALTILGKYMDEKDPRREISDAQYQQALDASILVLSAPYQAEPEVQLLGREILARQGRQAAEEGTRPQRWTYISEQLVRLLTGSDESAAKLVIQVLQEIGSPAIPALLEVLQQQSSEAVRLRVIEVLRVVYDPQALPVLLNLLHQPSPVIQKQVAEVLRAYAPESIPGLLDLILQGPNELVAEHAAQVLVSIGEPVVAPVTAALLPIVADRTRILVAILEQIHDPAAIPALVELLQATDGDTVLAITVVRALGQFSDPRVVSSLLAVLASNQPQLYEEAVTALSQMGEIALDGLIQVLNQPEETVTIQRVLRAILGMTPFPGEQLIDALRYCTEVQADYIIRIFKQHGIEGAQVLARHVLDKDEPVRDYALRAIHEMPGPVVVPAMLEIVHHPLLRKVAQAVLLKHPDSAIMPLVELLSEQDRGDAAVGLLPMFGEQILVPLLSGLDDSRDMANERAQRILVTLVRQSEVPQATLRSVLHLFAVPPPAKARESLLQVLSNQLSDLAIPALLDGLEDAYLIDDVSEVFERLASKGTLLPDVMAALIDALYSEEQRRGAATALVRIGAVAVPRVGALIIEPDRAVARTAREILCEMGAVALPFIWSAQSDIQHPERREAALDVFHSMRTELISEELISWLVSDRLDDVAMAVTLLLERIQDEVKQHYADQVMIPELVNYVQNHVVENVNLRVIALLLLLGENTILEYLEPLLDEHQQLRKQFLYALLLLGEKTHETLLEIFNDARTSNQMRAELVPVLGLMGSSDVIEEYARNLGAYGLSATRTSILFPEQLEIALRALGALLVSGYWDAQKLQEMRMNSEEGSPEHEMFSVLLGWRFEQQLTKLQSEMERLREGHKKELTLLGARMAAEQERRRQIEDELEESRRERTFRDDEFQQLVEEREEMQAALEQVTKERNMLRGQLQRVLEENDQLHEHIDQLNWQLDEQGR